MRRKKCVVRRMVDWVVYHDGGIHEMESHEKEDTVAVEKDAEKRPRRSEEYNCKRDS